MKRQSPFFPLNTRSLGLTDLLKQADERSSVILGETIQFIKMAYLNCNCALMQLFRRGMLEFLL